MIPYGHHEITQADIDAIIAVLQSNFLTQGPQVPSFEEAVADHIGAKHAIAVNSATSALHLACLAIGLGPGDLLWTSAITFVASANCALYCGADVDFVDIDLQTYNLCPKALELKLIEAERIGRVPKAIVVVHFCGQSCDMLAIHKLSKKYGFIIIEDASHAIGGKYKDEFIGNCRYSDIAIFSFHPVKIITTAEGGMALTNSDELARKIRLLRSHGITRDVSDMTSPSEGPWYYQQIDLGYNYRMSDLQAALGLSQLQRLDNYVDRRHKLAKRYTKLLKNIPVISPWQHPDTYSGMHLYVIRLQLDKIKITQLQAFEFLRQQGIGVNLHYIPVPAHPYYKKMGFSVENFPNAQRYYREAITIPLYQNLTEETQDFIIDSLQKILEP
jgi:UDP-4-amino-4,6-dideoxy-N-acetyl-beta-L-altrosamine transaminase